MKALVLCGGVPQIALIKELKSSGIETILADMNENVGARTYADKFYKVSVLDIEGVKHPLHLPSKGSCLLRGTVL